MLIMKWIFVRKFGLDHRVLSVVALPRLHQSINNRHKANRIKDHRRRQHADRSACRDIRHADGTVGTRQTDAVITNTIAPTLPLLVGIDAY